MRSVSRSRPRGERRSTATDRLPLFIPAQNRLCPSFVTGQRLASRPPPIGSKRITSAPSWASVIPPSGAATNAEPSTTRRPLRIPSTDITPCSGHEGDKAPVEDLLLAAVIGPVGPDDGVQVDHPS